MKTIEVNGETKQTAAATVADLLAEMDLEDARVATARNGEFLPAGSRATQTIAEGDRIEILAPMQGG